MLAMASTSCVKDELFDTPHPDKGALTVTTDWSDRSAEAGTPPFYTLMADGMAQEVSGETNPFTKLLLPGSHTLTVFNVPQGMTLSGTTLSVDNASPGEILHTPGYLFYCSQPFEIAADSEIMLTARMRQITRRLEMVISVTEGNFDHIAKASATLAGVCPSFDISTGKRSESQTETTADIVRDGDKLRLAYNLLGITSQTQQTLTVNITYTNGDTQATESDLSSLLSGYHGQTTALRLTADLSLPGDSQFSGTISGWQIADGGNFNAK